MTRHARYVPGPANAQVQKTADAWTLVLVRELRHPPARVWQALVDPAQLREWAPFDADGRLDHAGAAVRLTTVGAPSPHVTETRITRADEPTRLEYTWGGFDMRWELAPVPAGTRLTLWTSIDRRYIAMGAAGWHVCLDVLAQLLDGAPIGRLAGPEAMKIEGWQRLHGEYAAQFSGS